MTIQKALDLADELRPNMMKESTKIVFLCEIDQKIHGEIIMTHKHRPEDETKPAYDGDTDRGTVLLVPDPESMLYVYWLQAKIDWMNQEIDKFNNDMAMFDREYQEFSDKWRREHMPLSRLPFVVI